MIKMWLLCLNKTSIAEAVYVAVYAMKFMVKLVTSCSVIVKNAVKPMAQLLPAMAPIRKADFKIVQGEHLLKKFQSSETTQRCFCEDCGSPIISIKAETPDLYRLRIGTLDTPLQQKPTQHIFAASKAEWDSICDGLPQYDERA